jgi:hypothetical protein
LPIFSPCSYYLFFHYFSSFFLPSSCSYCHFMPFPHAFLGNQKTLITIKYWECVGQWRKKVCHNLTHLHYLMVIEFFWLLGNRPMSHVFGRVFQKDATN